VQNAFSLISLVDQVFLMEERAAISKEALTLLNEFPRQTTMNTNP